MKSLFDSYFKDSGANWRASVSLFWGEWTSRGQRPLNQWTDRVITRIQDPTSSTSFVTIIIIMIAFLLVVHVPRRHTEKWVDFHVMKLILFSFHSHSIMSKGISPVDCISGFWEEELIKFQSKNCPHAGLSIGIQGHLPRCKNCDQFDSTRLPEHEEVRTQDTCHLVKIVWNLRHEPEAYGARSRVSHSDNFAAYSMCVSHPCWSPNSCLSLCAMFKDIWMSEMIIIMISMKIKIEGCLMLPFGFS